MKIYQANKGKMGYLIIGSIILPIAIYFLNPELFGAKPFILLPLLAPVVISIYFYFSTTYKIVENKLVYKSGILKGNLEVASIKSIVKGNKKASNTLSPALAKDGLILKYNTSESLFIAPVNPDSLIADLVKINPEIECNA